jgi:hypothetical protein
MHLWKGRHSNEERRTTMQTPKVPDRDPVWWMAEYTIIWQRAEPTLRSEFERRQREQAKHQGPDNSVFGRAPLPRNVDVEHAHLVSEVDWETGMGWDDARIGLRFGVGARAKHQDQSRWTDELEALLREDWNKTYPPGLWQRVKRAVRRGFEHQR